MESERPEENGERDGPLVHGISADLLPHLWRFRTLFRNGRDAEKVLRFALRLSLDFFAAQEGCIATVQPGGDEAKILFPAPPEAWWDRSMLAGFLRGDKVRVPPELMLARIRRHGRMWGALAIRLPGGNYHWEERQAFSSIGALANELIDQIDRDRVRKVRARVDRKVMEQSQPKHLLGAVLHDQGQWPRAWPGDLPFHRRRDARAVPDRERSWLRHAGPRVATRFGGGLCMSMEPQGARILVVDDDPGILHAVSRILGRRHHVTCVASGPAAIEEANRLRPDLAVVDIRLPEMTGFEVTRA